MRNYSEHVECKRIWPFPLVVCETFGTRVESLSKDFGGIIFESLQLRQLVAASHRHLHKCNKVSWMGGRGFRKLCARAPENSSNLEK